MKRKLLIGISAIALLLSTYTAYAYFATRGLQIYLMGTRTGAILAGSWQFTLLAAILLWVPGIAVLFRKIAGLRRKEVIMAAEKQAEVIPGKETTDNAGLVEPKRGDTDKTELLESQRDSMAQTEPLAAKTGRRLGTRPLITSKRKEDVTERIVPEERGKKETEIPGFGGRGKTEPLQPLKKNETASDLSQQGPGEIENPIPETDESKAPVHSEKKDTVTMTPQYCPKCGNLVTGKKYCSKCGTKISKEA